MTYLATRRHALEILRVLLQRTSSAMSPRTEREAEHYAASLDRLDNHLKTAAESVERCFDILDGIEAREQMDGAS